MSQQKRSTLKTYFKEGDKPTSDQFTDLVDSCLNQTDDGLFAPGTNRLGIGGENDNATLFVQGNLVVSSSEDTSSSYGLYVEGKTGIGTDMQKPKAKLAVNGQVYFGADAVTESNDCSLTVVNDITANDNLFADTADIGSTSGSDTLHIGGTFNVTGDTKLKKGNLTLASGMHIEVSNVQASGSSLALTNSDDKGLTIDSSGNVSADGNLVLPATKYIEAVKVQAKQSESLTLTNSAGTDGLTIHSGGGVSASTTVTLGSSSDLEIQQFFDHTEVTVTKTNGFSEFEHSFDRPLTEEDGETKLTDDYMVTISGWHYDSSSANRDEDGYVYAVSPYLLGDEWRIKFSLYMANDENDTAFISIYYNYYKWKSSDNT